MDFLAGIASARLQQQDLDAGILTQAAGQNASGGTGADDDVVIHGGTPGWKGIVARIPIMKFVNSSQSYSISYLPSFTAAKVISNAPLPVCSFQARKSSE